MRRIQQPPHGQCRTQLLHPSQTIECISSVGAVATLDGSGSTDPDSDLLSFLWADSGIVFDDSASSTPSATFPLGITRVNLTVTDPGGLRDSDAVDITVEDTTPPSLSGQWVPLDGDDDEGGFRLEFSGADVCDSAQVTITQPAWVSHR